MRKELKEHAASIAHNVKIAAVLVEASDGPGFEQKLRGEEVIFDMLWDSARDGYAAVDQVLGRWFDRARAEFDARRGSTRRAGAFRPGSHKAGVECLSIRPLAS